MAIFVHSVTIIATRFFSSVVERGRVLVCEIDARSPAAGALIVPIAAGAGVVEKIQAGQFATGWDGRRRFFADLVVWFEGPPAGRPGGGQAFLSAAPTARGDRVVGQALEGPSLVYPESETSLDDVVLLASPAALDELEPPLRPGPELRALLTRAYADHAIALCPTPAGLSRACVAVTYVPRDPTRVAFPLLEVTDGRGAAPETTSAQDLFGQHLALGERVLPFTSRYGSLGRVAPPPLPSFVRTEAPVDIERRPARLPNQDLEVPTTT